MDLSKAFDKVSHSILVAKLVSYGITGPLLSWFKCYISDRPVTVAFNGAGSRPFVPTSGVAQGSILGPLLFVLYINDLADVCESFNLLYADDCKLAKVINSVEDALSLQHDLDAIGTWCTSNKLHVNAAKCSAMTVTNRTSNVIRHSYKLGDDAPIESATSTKDLGVVIDNKLRFNEHVEKVANKAFRSLGFLIRTSRHFVTIDAILYLYTSTVLPHLDYAATIWSPFYGVHTETVEKVQRRFTRFVYRKFRLPYSDYHSRIKFLGLLSLSKRRLLADQMYLYSIVRGFCSVRSSIINISYRTNRTTRHHQLFYEKTWLINSTFNAPVARMVRDYNRHFHDIDIFNLSKADYRKTVFDKLCGMPN